MSIIYVFKQKLNVKKLDFGIQKLYLCKVFNYKRHDVSL